MNEPGLVTISMIELQRVKVIQAVVERRLTVACALAMRSLGVVKFAYG